MSELDPTKLVLANSVEHERVLNIILTYQGRRNSLWVVHDLVLKTIAKFLRSDYRALLSMISVCKRFYQMRHLFIQNLVLGPKASYRAYLRQDLMGVYGMTLTEYSNNVKVDDLSFLANSRIKQLYIHRCWTLRDVSPLSHLKTLCIRECHQIRDFTPLGRVKLLIIEHCIGLRNPDLAALGSVEELQILSCHNITDVSPLSRVKRLYLEGLPGLIDVSALGQVKLLCLSYCHSISDVSPLKTVSHLILSHCNGITDVSALGRVKTLEIISCQNLKTGYGHMTAPWTPMGS